MDNTQKTIQNLPINTLSKQLKFFGSEYFLSKSGVVLNKNCTKFIFSGHSLGKDKNITEMKSIYELKERLLASKFFHDTKIKTLPKYNFDNNKQVGSVSTDKLLLDNENSLIDASGLSCHESIEKAIKHSAYELIERHILSSFWYKDTKMINIDDLSQQEGDYSIKFYFANTNPVIPFCMCVIYSEFDGLFIGSALEDNFEDAKDKSYLEALMLLSNKSILKGNTHNNRLDTLTNIELNKRRKEYIDSKSLEIKDDKDFKTVSNYIKTNNVSIQYAIITDSRNLFVVRSFSNNLLKIREQRLKCNSINDPFC